MLPDLPKNDFLRILREFDYYVTLNNERHIILRNYFNYSRFAFEDLIITIPNTEIIIGPIIESALKQGRISKIDYVEKLKSNLYIEHKPLLVAHVDILGFKNLMENVKTNPSKFDELLNKYNIALKQAFTQIKSFAEYSRSDHWYKISHVRIYTDNLLLLSELNPDERHDLAVEEFMKEIATYQLNLALEGFFTRGVVLLDLGYCDDILVFSPALLYSNKYEHKAVYPRVIIEGEALKYIKEHFEWNLNSEYYNHTDLILIDGEGDYFINYLYIISIFNDDVTKFKRDEDGAYYYSKDKYYPTAIDELYKHRDEIQKNLEEYKDDPNVYKKYLWLAGYHNFFCKKYFPRKPNALIEEVECLSFYKASDLEN